MVEERERSDVIAIGAQEASYVKTKKTTKPSAVSAACGDVEPFKSRFKKGFFHSSKWTRLGMMMGGAMAGGVMGRPGRHVGCSPVGTEQAVGAEIKVRVHWFDFLHASVGSEYALLQSEMLLQMRLVVFVKKTPHAAVRASRLAQRRRVGKSRRKQGGIVVHIELDNGETIAFVSCHLAAHENQSFFRLATTWCQKSSTGVGRLSTAIGSAPVVKDINATFFDTGNEVFRKFKGAVTKTSNAFETATGARSGAGTRREKIKCRLVGLDSPSSSLEISTTSRSGSSLGNEWDALEQGD